jgi:methylenetetrahydrofolate dehydrogenase (NADP+)/methenyltetrahydrofolate cyclohydrolase
MTTLIDGRQLSAQLEAQVQEQVQTWHHKGVIPGLSVIQVGHNPASTLYVQRKHEKARSLGIQSWIDRFPADVDEEIVLKRLKDLNADPLVHGILIQLPLPQHWNVGTLLSHIHPNKDVDGLHPLNLGYLVQGKPRLVPCTPMGCLQLIQSVQPSLAGQRAVVVGRSNLVGKPLTLLLLQHDATVIFCHSQTNQLESLCQQADILISAVGKSGLITDSHVKEGAVVIDVGINSGASGKLVGDVDWTVVAPKTRAITPVPGGVGPMTIANLMNNTLKALTLQQSVLKES